MISQSIAKISTNRFITFQDSNAVAVITSDESVRGGKVIPLKQTVDRAMETCPTVKTVFVVKRTGAEVKMGPNEMFLQVICLNLKI